MRHERIINYLFKKNQLVTPKELTSQFEISERTLQNDFKLIEHIGTSAGFQVTRIRGIGYRLKISDRAAFSKYLQELAATAWLDTDDPTARIKNIQLILLFSNDFITLGKLADLMDISVSTVKKDIKHVDILLEKHHLKLYSKAHYGIRVIGSEKEKRTVILKILKKQVEAPPFTKKYQKFKLNFDQVALRRKLTEDLAAFHLKVNDVVFENLIQHIELLCFRISQNNSIHDESCPLMTTETIYDGLTEKIVRYLTPRYQLTFSEAEKTYLKEQLRGKITVLNDESATIHLTESITDALHVIDQSYHTDFSQDETLTTALNLHIAPLLQRLYTGHQLENPIIEDIYTRYANVFNLSLEFITTLNKKLETKISKDEIGYIAIYFAASLEKQANQAMDNYRKIAVICATGGGAAYLLKVHLERLFSNAEVTTFPLNELERIGSQYDLLISTVPLAYKPLIPVIFTTSMMTERDLHKIEQDLSLLREAADKPLDLNQRLVGLFKKEWFQFTSEQDYLAVLKKASQRLEEQEWAEKGYSASVLERESLIDTIYRQGIAGPHPMEPSAKKEVISVVFFKAKTFYQKKEVRLLFLLNIHKEHLTLHKEISRLMIAIMEDLNRNQEVEKIKDYEDFLAYIKSLLRRGTKND